MLDKISNISAGGEYSKSVKSNGFNSVLGAVYNKKTDLHDSVDISPALQYLNQAHWRLKEFKHSENEKLYLAFIVSDIEFQVNIEFALINSMNMLNYRVIKDRKGSNWRSKTFMEIASSIEEIKYNENPSLINFSALNILLQRIFDLNVFREINSTDSYILNGLLEDIKFGIKNEFGYMNNYLFTFIEKLTGIKANKSFAGNNTEADSIIIKKIKVLNAE